MRIIVVGTGNVSSHMTPALLGAGHDVVGVWGRNVEAAKLFAQRYGIPHLPSLSSNLPPSDVVLMAVADNAISEVSHILGKCGGAVVAHTSGATPVDAINASRSGVFYPCQTFSKSDSIDMANVPFLIEGSDEQSSVLLKALAESISRRPVIFADSVQRKRLHLAAVFASNFFNHLLLHANGVLEQAGLSLDILEPLVLQTATKAFVLGPYDAQTGPARRGDTGSIERHMGIMDEGYTKEIYQLLSESIGHTYCERK